MTKISEFNGIPSEIDNIQNNVTTLLSQFDLKNKMNGGGLFDSVSTKTIGLVNQTFMNK